MYVCMATKVLMEPRNCNLPSFPTKYVLTSSRKVDECKPLGVTEPRRGVNGNAAKARDAAMALRRQAAAGGRLTGCDSAETPRETSPSGECRKFRELSSVHPTHASRETPGGGPAGSGAKRSGKIWYTTASRHQSSASAGSRGIGDTTVGGA